MTYINEAGYLERKTNSKKNPHSQATYRNWWLIKATERGMGYLTIRGIYFPKEWVGKRVRFKIEEVEE